jgi:hypothetical protein
MKWVIRGLSGSHEVEVERSGEGFEVTVDGRRHVIDLICLDGAVASLRFVEDGRSFQVAYQQGDDHRWRVGVREREFDFSVLTPVEAIDEVSESTGRGSRLIEAPIPGKVVSVAVGPGEERADFRPGRAGGRGSRHGRRRGGEWSPAGGARVTSGRRLPRSVPHARRQSATDSGLGGIRRARAHCGVAGPVGSLSRSSDYILFFVDCCSLVYEKPDKPEGRLIVEGGGVAGSGRLCAAQSGQQIEC